jgi:hypothetical protein
VSGEFKTNCAIVILDFLIRHGVIKADTGEYEKWNQMLEGMTRLQLYPFIELYVSGLEIEAESHGSILLV